MTQPAQSALDRSFAEICERHGLSSLSLTYHVRPRDGGGFFSANAQQMVEGERVGAQGLGDTLAEAIGKAIAQLDAEPITLADEPLPEVV